MTRRFAERGEVVLPAGKLAYRRTRAEGIPLVLLHPLALGSAIWELGLNELGHARDVIAVDLRGHGDSGWNGTPFTIDDLAQDIVELLRLLDVNRCDMAGMSMGGCVAMSVAASHPSLVRNLALCDTTAWYGPGATAAWEERAHAAEQKPRQELIGFQTQRWFSEGFRERRPEDVQHIVDIFVHTRAEVHAQACRALGAFDARPRLHRITASTLSLTGEEDYATPPDMGRALAVGIPNADFKQWPGVRHFSVVESRELRESLARHLNASAG
jgi:3-oxoadipate enol-lactonase